MAALLAARVLVDFRAVDLGPAGANGPFALAPLLGSAVVAGGGAAVAFAALVRLTDRPVRNFLVLATVVFAAMLVPVAVVAPTVGVTPAGQAVLVVLHATVAVPLVACLIGRVGL